MNKHTLVVKYNPPPTNKLELLPSDTNTMLSFLMDSSDPCSWVLLGCAILGMALYVLSVKSLGKYSMTHSCLLTGLVLLTPLSNKSTALNTDPKQKKSSQTAASSSSASLLESMEFHQSTLQAGSIPLQALQQQQQQQGRATDSSTTENSNARNDDNSHSSASPRSPMLQFWKDVDALVCLMVACAIYFLVQEFILSSHHTRNPTVRIGKPVAWWFLGMTTVRIILQSLYTVWTTPIQAADSAAGAPLVRRRRQQSTDASSTSTISWLMALASTSPRSVLHALVGATSVVIYYGGSSSASSLTRIAHEVAVRGELWKRLVVETPANGSNDVTENTTTLLVLQNIVLFAGTFSLLFVLAEPIQLLQTALWHSIYRQGTLKQQLLVPRAKQPTMFLRSVNFWMARLAFWNLWIVPVVWMGATYYCTASSDNGDSSSTIYGNQLHLYLVAIWVVSLFAQMHSLLQDYLLGALLTCVHILRPQHAQQQQQQQQHGFETSANTLNSATPSEKDDSETLTWMSNLFASRSSTGLLARANQFIVVPCILLLLISAASLPGLDYTTTIPIAYQTGSNVDFAQDPSLAWWQELSDWNHDQFQQVLSNSSVTSNPHDLLDSDITSPPGLDSTPLFPLLKQLQEHAQQSLDDPKVHRALTSSVIADADSSDPTIQAVYWNLLRIRFTLSKIVHHSVLSQTVVAGIAWEMMGIFMVYWIISAMLCWKHGEFQEYSRHAQFLQKTLDKNKASEAKAKDSTGVKEKAS